MIQTKKFYYTFVFFKIDSVPLFQSKYLKNYVYIF